MTHPAMPDCLFYCLFYLFVTCGTEAHPDRSPRVLPTAQQGSALLNQCTRT